MFNRRFIGGGSAFLALIAIATGALWQVSAFGHRADLTKVTIGPNTTVRGPIKILRADGTILITIDGNEPVVFGNRLVIY
jgi:hypothetical protein